MHANVPPITFSSNPSHYVQILRQPANAIILKHPKLIILNATDKLWPTGPTSGASPIAKSHALTLKLKPFKDEACLNVI
jgi:hypothetical protein